MQIAFDFGTPTDITLMRDRLRSMLSGYRPHNLREPIGQMIKSLISSRTKDEVSLRAYERLIRRYPRWSDLAQAPATEIEAVIAKVTFADEKARNLKAALGIIAVRNPDFDLSFLKNMPTPQALAWLEALPGVGPKVAASTLNFSTLAMPAFVVDTHVLRVLARFGIVGARADIETAYARVMAAATDWTASDFSEFHVLVKRLGQTVCRFETPLCNECPLKRDCPTAKSAAPKARFSPERYDAAYPAPR
ncbi:HhH-GPD family protein [Rhizobium sp. CF080]|uniref:endonuclease III domain-containing protein n=1 Tax=Rhizobium sp. (strain CF080) TaxID=1144310 RepID=UPI000271CD6A|nr:putative endoIII-related endonuclease [Rhizobium sp. CF080]EUB95555.1 HhH-GPD family protein [Rhizobium sp. CF080]